MIMDKDREVRMKIKIFEAIIAAATLKDPVNIAHKANRVFEILKQDNND